MKERRGIALIGIGLMLTFAVAARSANGTAPRYSGTITSAFDTPVLSGAFLDIAGHLPVPRDNTSTAARSGIGTPTVTWGGDDKGSLAPSSLEFAGDAFADVAPGQVFRLGTLTYSNGPGTPQSLIFGVTMHLSAGDGIEPFAGPVDIVSSQNGNVDQLADADVLVLGTLANPSTLAAFEGAAVKANVYGRIDDGSRLVVTSIDLAPGETTHGCVGSGPLTNWHPCPSACGEACTRMTLALAAPLCGGEQLPAALDGRIRRALDQLGAGATADTERKAKRAVRLAMKGLQSSAKIAGRAAERGRISRGCADAIGKAIGNARAQAEGLLGPR